MPTVTAASDGSYTVGYQFTANTGPVHQLVYVNVDAAGLVGSQTNAVTGSDAMSMGTSSARLTNGDIAMVYRYDATGNTVGTVFTFDSSNANHIDAVLLGDGRVALSWQNGEIHAAILDARDVPNGTGVYAPNGYVIGTPGDDDFTADFFADFVYGHTGNDIIHENGTIKNYYGGGDDELSGGSGGDTLKGRAGSDTLNGNRGNDTLVGGGASDTFVFVNKFGKDTIKDFDANDNAEDIDLSGVSSIKGFRDLTNNHMTQKGDDVVINGFDGNRIIVLDVSLGDMDKADFIF